MNNTSKINFGYSLTANDLYMFVGAPAFSASNLLPYKSGSVKLYSYDVIKDSYTFDKTIKFVPSSNTYTFLHALESSNDDILSTENSLYFELEFSASQFRVVKDGFGISVASDTGVLAVANPYFEFLIGATTVTGSGVVLYSTPYDQEVSLLITNSFEAHTPSSSFGYGLDIKDDYVAIGIPGAYGNKGCVQIYKYDSANFISASLVQTLTGSVAQTGSLFGEVVRFDRSSSYNIVVGNGLTGSLTTSSVSNKAYLFAYSASEAWTESEIFSENKTIEHTLNYADYAAYDGDYANRPSGFGNSVSMYGNLVIIGSPLDTIYYEYSGSTSVKYGGAVYVFKNCVGTDDYTISQKFFGNSNIDATNKFGFAVDINEDYASVSSLKYAVPFDAGFITASLQSEFVLSNIENFDLQGNIILYSIDSDSNLQEVKTITRNKVYNQPFRNFGFNVALTDNGLIQSSPIFCSNATALSDSDVYKGQVEYFSNNALQRNIKIGKLDYSNGNVVLSKTGSLWTDLFKLGNDENYPYYDMTYSGSLEINEKCFFIKIEPGEFNQSTNPSSFDVVNAPFDILNDGVYDIKDTSIILSSLSNRIFANPEWWVAMDLSEADLSVVDMYDDIYSIKQYANSSSAFYYTRYNTQLEDLTTAFDVTKDKTLDINDMYILFYHVLGRLRRNNYSKFIRPTAARKDFTELVRYLETNTKTIKTLNPHFLEFNHSSSTDLSGSYLAPYITSVGLYNGTEMVAIAKTGFPMKNIGKFPTNILIRMDF